MRIITFLHSREIGWWLQRMASEIHNSLAGDGHYMFLYALYDSQRNESFFGNNFVASENISHSFFIKFLKLFSRSLILSRYVRKNSIDCIISHGDDVNFSALLLRFFCPSICIIPVLHQDLSIYQHNSIYKALFFLLYRFADISILVSSTLVDNFVKLTNVKKYNIIQNGVSLKDITNKSQEPFDFHNLPEHYYLSIGRLTCQKWWIGLLRAFAFLVRDNPKKYLVIIGDGDMLDVIGLFIKKNNLQRNIRLLGVQKNPWVYYTRATAFVLPSFAESFGLVFLESLALGIPIISSDIPALRLIHNSLSQSIPTSTPYWYMVSPSETLELSLNVPMNHQEQDMYDILSSFDSHVSDFLPCVLRERAEVFSLEKSLQEWRKLIKTYES